MKPVTNYGLIASLAIDCGCTSLGELLFVLALHLCRPSPADVAAMQRVFTEYHARHDTVTVVRRLN